ncbi:Torsin 1 [Mactra antiquata]
MHWKVFFAVFAVFQHDFLNAELVSAASAGVVSWISSNILYCSMNECCIDSWIPANYSGLAETLKSKLHGQHLVTDLVIKYLKAHGRGNPSKALVLSFHGRTGTGKSYVSRLVAEKLFYNGMESKYVHLFSATRDFNHIEKVPTYKKNLRDHIEKAVKECPRSLFIFDEMDKMPPGIIDTLKPYLDHYEQIGNVDYRKTIFFFLSNSGSNAITERALRAWKNGEARHSLKLKEMEQIIQEQVLNTKNGLLTSELVLKNLITAYVPFLPLERCHVKQCIRDGLVERGYYLDAEYVNDMLVREIADELTYFPKDVSLFSVKGCKSVHDKIVYVKEDF